MTSLDMNGFSLTLMRVDAPVMARLDAPHQVTGVPPAPHQPPPFRHLSVRLPARPTSVAMRLPLESLRVQASCRADRKARQRQEAIRPIWLLNR